MNLFMHCTRIVINVYWIYIFKVTGTGGFENMSCQLIEKVSVHIHFTLDLFLLRINLLYNIVR